MYLVMAFALLAALGSVLASPVRSQNTRVQNGTVGRMLVTDQLVFVATSDGLWVYNTDLNTTLYSLLPGKEVIALGVGGSYNEHLFVCYRSPQGQGDSRCELRAITKNMTLTVRSTLDLYNSSHAALSGNLDYAELSRSTVATTDGNTFFLGLPAFATNGERTQTVIRFEAEGRGWNILKDTGRLYVDPGAPQNKFTTFAGSFVQDGAAYVIYSRPNVTVGNRSMDATFLSHVCLTDKSATHHATYPGIYLGYDEMTIPGHDTKTLSGNTVVDATLDEYKLYVFLAWKPYGNIPSFISRIKLSTINDLFDSSGLNCVQNRNWQGAQFLDRPAGKCSSFMYTYPMSAPVCGTGSVTQNTVRYPLSIINQFTSVESVLSLASAPHDLQMQYEFRSLAVRDLKSVRHIFIGTATGEVLKSLKKYNFFLIYEVIQIDPQRRPITDIMFASDSTIYYAAARGANSSTVYGKKSIDCGVFMTCSRCVNPSRHNRLVEWDRHPMCQWNIPEARCDEGDDISFARSEASCPTITSITPSRVTVGHSRNITIQTSKFPGAKGRYRCGFPEFSSFESNATISTGSNGVQFTCASPPDNPMINQIPNTTVTLYSEAYNKVVLVSDDVKLYLVDCASFTRCEQCTDPSLDCTWCSGGNACNRVGECSDGTSQCPVVLSINPKSIAANDLTSFTITGKYFPSGGNGGQYECQIADANGSISQRVGASLTNNIVSCNSYTLNPTLLPLSGPGSVNVTIVPVYNDYALTLDNQNNTVLAYDCKRFNGSCSECRNALFSQCVWCPDTHMCALRHCTGATHTTCNLVSTTMVGSTVSSKMVGSTVSPKMVGSTVSPKMVGSTVSPKMAGSTVSTQMVGSTVSPKMAGSTVSTTMVGSTVSPKMAGSTVSPKMVGSTVSTQMVGSTVSPKMVGFTTTRPHVTRRVDGISPLSGGLTGGTLITISGVDLDTANQTSVMFGSAQSCTDIEKSSTSITCKTPAGILAYTQVDVVLDEYKYTTHFTYRPDPVISRVHRNRSISVGGVLIAFSGTNFDVPLTRTASFTYFLSNVPKTMNTTCSVMNTVQPALLSCKSPAIPEGVTANISLQMDGKYYPAVSSITYDGLPTFVSVEHILELGSAENLTIEGDNITIGDLTAQEYKVMIGNSTCQDVTIATKQLSCQPPAKEPGQTSNGTFPILITVGNLQRQSAGHVKYRLPSPGSRSSTFVGEIVGSIVAMLACGAVIMALIYRHRNVTGKMRVKGNSIDDLPMTSNAF